jgi:hypothetical protein
VPYRGWVSVRETLDQLIAEPGVADPGYPADQRMVATLVLGLKLLADSIDHLEARLAHTTRPLEVVHANVVPREMRDITAEIHDITAQVGKLAKMIKKAAKEK